MLQQQLLYVPSSFLTLPSNICHQLFVKWRLSRLPQTVYIVSSSTLFLPQDRLEIVYFQDNVVVKIMLFSMTSAMNNETYFLLTGNMNNQTDLISGICYRMKLFAPLHSHGHPFLVW